MNPTTTPHLHIIPFTPNHQSDARNLILRSLGEHWGWINEQINTDLVDIPRSYSSGHFILGCLDEASFTLNTCDFVIPLNVPR